jgi:hypothetical protein
LKIILLLLLPLFVTNAYGHGTFCGVSCGPAGAQPIPRISDNLLMQFFHYNQDVIFDIMFAGTIVFTFLVLFVNIIRKTESKIKPNQQE